MARAKDWLLAEQEKIAARDRATTAAPVPRISFDGIVSQLDALRHESASLGLEQSYRLCGNPLDDNPVMTGDGCRKMHGGWQYLNLLGLAANPERNTDFYRDAIRRFAQERPIRRLLIAGCCDYTMLAIVLSALDRGAKMPVITVIDRCDTPLYLCQWFADRYDLDISTEQTDVVGYAPDDPFDLICTDGLLTVFRAEDRPGLVTSWHRLLAPGGAVVTTNNLGNGEARKATMLSPEAISTLCERGVETRRKSRPALDLSDDEIRTLIADHFSRPRPTYVESENVFRSLFRPEQFFMARFEVSEIGGIAIQETGKNGEIQKTLNGRIVAIRR